MKTITISSRSITSVFTLLLFLFVLGTACVTQKVKSEIESKVDEYINAYLEMGKFSGSILIAQKGEVLVSKGYGMANYELDVPNTPQTKFRLGSVTKQFTAMAIMQLQEQGKLGVDDLVSKHVDDSPEAWKDITIHNLLTHTSGIPSYTGFPEYHSLMSIPTNSKELVGRFRDKPLDFVPGEKHRYSNSGYNLLGFIIEKVSGMTYKNFLHENIFKPLNMTSSGYDLPIPVLKNRASGYTLRNGKILNAEYIHMSVPYSGGALYSTAEDLYKWDRALYTEKLVKKSSLDKIFTPFKNNYAYGWMISKFLDHKLIGHGGSVNGFRSNISRYVDDDACIILLTNLVGIRDIPRSKITNDLAAILFGEKYELFKERKAIDLDPKIYDAYVGQYELEPDFIITITKENDRLFTQARRQPKFEILPESETKFFLKEVAAQITFVKNEKGEVTQLVFHRGGRDRTGKKVK